MFVLYRKNIHPEYTLGELHIEDERIGYTLEDPVREFRIGETWKWDKLRKIAGRTAIPSGTYPLSLTMSSRFGVVLPLLSNVPDFTGVRIHGGNSVYDTEGCILLGLSGRTDKGWVGDCAPAVARCKLLIERVAALGQPTITIYNRGT